ncbi:hypothetical protein DFS33DRAFT_176056 [Desarmillaria ectypa]|nr:hypothetical protein DFS33DRAFT_176056 [Desarmillaria ectypa]
MAVGPHIICSNIMVLLHSGQSSEDLESETLASVVEHICRLEFEILARDDELKQSQEQATFCLHREKDLAVQDLENHKSISAPIRRLPNDALLRVFEMSICIVSVQPWCGSDLKTVPWLLGYVCHHWRALSHTSPSLWTGIYLQSVHSSDHPGKRYLRQKFLSLSGSFPLRIRVDTIHRLHANGMPYRPDGRVCPGDVSQLILEDIALHSHRWSHMG